MAGDMKSMPGMKMAPNKSDTGKQAKKKAVRSGKSKNIYSQRRAMDHSKMLGMPNGQMQVMDHSKMQGMPDGRMQGVDYSKMQGMPDGQMQGTDHSKMDGMSSTQMQGMDHRKMQGMGNGAAMDMGAMTKSMQGGSAPADARDPDVYADGLTLGPMPGMDMADNVIYAQLLLGRLEVFRTGRSHGQAVDAQGWVSGDIDKL